jgi:hypothetical protein
MAIFASTTLGTGDPSRAMSIKALETRAQALAAAQAKQELPTSLPSPWQGASLVMNQAADAFATKRADQAAAQRRQDLAGYMAKAGDNPSMADVGQITAADPDVGKTYLQEIQQRRSQAAQIQAQKELAAQQAQQTEAAAVAAEQRLGARPKSDVAQIEADLRGGRLSPEDATAAKKKLTAPSASEQKAANEQEDANVELQSTLAGLKEGYGLLKDDKVYSGGGAGFKEFMGKNLPTVGGYVAGTDPEKTKATQRYNQIVTPQVLDFLAKLKGASSDRDMNLAIDTLNDRSADIETKKRAMETLIPKIAAHLELNQRRMKEMGREPVKVDTPPPVSGAPAAPAAAAGPARPPSMDDAALVAQAKAAIAAGKDPAAVKKQLEAWGVKGGL